MRRAGLAVLAALALAPAATQAEPTAGVADASEAPVDHFTPAGAQAFAARIEATLAAQGVRLAMVFRSGEPHDELPKSVRYTHGAFWVRQSDGSYRVYNLFAGDGRGEPLTRSHLAVDRPVDFVRGSAVDDVGVLVPTPAVQAATLAVIASPRYAQLHNPSYSLIGDPWRSLHQNCNGFMLDVVASAGWRPASPTALRAEERARFQPTVIPASPIERLFAPLKDRRIRLDDQDAILRTVTYESMSRFLAAEGWLQRDEQLVVSPSAPPQSPHPAR